jgi:hypothetical protein
MKAIVFQLQGEWARAPDHAAQDRICPSKMF